MAFSHIVVISTLFETLDVISVWLDSVINPRVLCVSAIPIQGWHLSTETWPSEVGSLQDGIRAHTDCRTRPLAKGKGYSSLLISNSSPFLLYRWRTQGTSFLNRMKTHLLVDTWRKSLGTWTSKYQASPGPTPPLYQKRSVGWFEFKFQEGHSCQLLSQIGRASCRERV